MATATTAAPAGSDIAQDALKYAGATYVYGGPAARPGDWDCSSFVSYVLGHDLGMVLPGGGKYGAPAYPPNAHGPVVLSYAGWAGATTLPAGMSPSAGDLCVFPGAGPLGHIGIAIDASHMISALDTESGTLVSPIVGYGPAGVAVEYRRVNGAAQTATIDDSSGTLAGYSAIAGTVLAAGALPLVFAGALLALAGLIALAGAAGIAAIMARSARS
jgi:cell wall-associated NlpC family hydrolase